MSNPTLFETSCAHEVEAGPFKAFTVDVEKVSGLDRA